MFSIIAQLFCGVKKISDCFNPFSQRCRTPAAFRPGPDLALCDHGVNGQVVFSQKAEVAVHSRLDLPLEESFKIRAGLLVTGLMAISRGIFSRCTHSRTSFNGLEPFQYRCPGLFSFGVENRQTALAVGGDGKIVVGGRRHPEAGGFRWIPAPHHRWFPSSRYLRFRHVDGAASSKLDGLTERRRSLRFTMG